MVRPASTYRELQRRDPVAIARIVGTLADWQGTVLSAFSDEQAAGAVQIIRDNADVRWTFLLMHLPACGLPRTP